MTTQTETMKLALEALEVVTKELLAVRDELAERGGRPKTNVFHQRLWDSSHTVYTDKAIPAAIALREALAEQEPVTSGKVVRLKDAFYAGFESYVTPAVSYSDVDEEWAKYAAAHGITKGNT